LKRLSTPKKNQGKDDETTIREILTELIDKNDKIIKSFNSLLKSLKRELRDRFLQKQEIQLNGKKLEESYLELLDIITESLRYNQHDDIIQEMKDRITKGHNPSNRKQNEGEQDEGDSEVLRDGHSEVASKTSGYVSNMLIDGRDIEVENTISKDSGGVNNMLVDGEKIKVENSVEQTSSENSGGANNMLVDGKRINIKNSGGGSGSNNSGSANNMIIKGSNINLGDSVEPSVGKNSGSANNLVIKGNNINLGDFGSGSGSNNSGESNNILIKGSDFNLGGSANSKKSGPNSLPLRPVIIPQEMVQKFRMKAKSNTNEQLETSAILLGKQSENKFTITHMLFLPRNENKHSGVTDIQEKLLAKQSDLIALGWISTSPSMKSIDFHTYFDNRQLVNEAIAIVVAKDDGIGIYKLTTLRFIADSRSSKIPVKNEKELFDKTPPHIKIESLKVELMDLD